MGCDAIKSYLQCKGVSSTDDCCWTAFHKVICNFRKEMGFKIAPTTFGNDYHMMYYFSLGVLCVLLVDTVVFHIRACLLVVIYHHS